MYYVGITKMIAISLLFLAGTDINFDILLTTKACEFYTLHDIKRWEIKEEVAHSSLCPQRGGFLGWSARVGPFSLPTLSKRHATLGKPAFLNLLLSPVT